VGRGEYVRLLRESGPEIRKPTGGGNAVTSHDQQIAEESMEKKPFCPDERTHLRGRQPSVGCVWLARAIPDGAAVPAGWTRRAE
jgi:hypothetical protein